MKMGIKPFFSKHSITHFSKFNRKCRSSSPHIHINSPSVTTISPSIPSSQRNLHPFSPSQNPQIPKPISFLSRSLHSLQENSLVEAESDAEDEENDGPMNEFLSRFVWIIRGKLSEAYPNCDKETIEGMLLIIVKKVVEEMEKGGLEEMLDSAKNTQVIDFSQDLWKTVWEVSNSVLDDMRKARKMEEMKKFLHSEDVKEMCRFAGEVGIRGDMLRELRFKWAREKLEEKEFYQSLERLREEALEEENVENKDMINVEGDDSLVTEKPKDIEIVLPQRRGKIKYKIYGLDLSSQKWAEVADRIHEAEKVFTPEEPKPIYGKCKVVTERILGLKAEEDPSPHLAEWVELLRPGRVDWLALLDGLNERNPGLYFKLAELVLDEESFETNIRDYSKLIDTHAKGNRIEDAERILQKMTKKNIEPDILTSTILVHMYGKTGNLERAKDAFEKLRSQGFQPDMRAYNSMIMAYVNAGQPKSGESLMREMEARDFKPTREIYMELLKAFAQRGHVDGAQRIVNTMQFAGFQPTLESCTLLVEAYGQAADPDQARNNFDYMIKAGHKPDDRCTASMIAAYEKKNLLDKALNLLLELEKDGFEPGIATYTVLVDWLGKLQLVDEAEQVLGKITEKGDAPPFKIHVSLCDMYSRAGIEKKALKSLGIVKNQKERLRAEDFERIIYGLLAGGLVQDANKVSELMHKQGFTSSEPIKVALMAAQAMPRQKPTTR
ncbi:pentatricopeptide (PPR) repeat-containing protein [Tasmannia lanceolata]|uniref:pentatricopeptide (PPR) repeat-containing protein n=1 Tax=Tasmannia lanceolata TaxID=3420 RepID=UPI00406394DD